MIDSMDVRAKLQTMNGSSTNSKDAPGIYQVINKLGDKLDYSNYFRALLSHFQE